MPNDKHNIPIDNLFIIDNFQFPIYLGTHQATQFMKTVEIEVHKRFRKTIIFGVRPFQGDYTLTIKYEGDEGLVFSDIHKFITFEDGSLTKQISINSRIIQCTILLHPEYLVDCTENQESIHCFDNFFYYPINFSISIANEKGATIVNNYRTQIQVALKEPVLKAQFILDQSELEWRDPNEPGADKIRIGNLVLNHDIKEKCSPSITVDFKKLKAINKDASKADNAIILEWNSIEETNAKKEYPDPEIAITRNESCLKKTEVLNNVVRIEHLYSNPDAAGKPNLISIPLYWQMPKDNPNDDQLFDLTAELEWFYQKINQDDDHREKVSKNEIVKKQFTLKRNWSETALEVRAGFDDLQIIDNKGTVPYHVPYGVSAAPGEAELAMSIDVCNKARANNNNGSVIIKNFGLELTGAISGSSPFPLNAEDYIAIENNALKKNLRIPYNNPIQRKRVEFSISDAKILQLLDTYVQRSLDLMIKFSFKCIVDKDGTYSKQEEINSIENSCFEDFEGFLRCKVARDPQPEWVSLDFGTSAVVAAVGLGNELSVLDLKKAKIEEVLRKNFPHQPDKTKELEDGKMISSAVAINKAGTRPFDADLDDVTKYKDLPLWFSPSPGMIEQETQLPCLKYLATTNALPPGGYSHSDTKYKDKSGIEYRGFYESNSYGYKKPIGLGKIENLFDTVYRQLLTWFMKPALPIEKINKMVLTIPNTFSKMHEEDLKALVLRVYPEVWPEYLTLVSESDAVACYFAYNNKRFLDKLQSSERRSQLEKNEKVLVDLIKDKTIQDQFKKYLELDREKRNNNGISYAVVNTFKEYVKREVKPNLNGDETVGLSNYKDKGLMSEPFKDITIGDIKNNKKFKSFIASCTTDILETFTHLFNISKKDVDIVVFSGRSSSLDVIRQHVANFFTENTLYADIQNTKMLTKNDFYSRSTNHNNEMMKMIVSMGALAKVSMSASRQFKMSSPAIFASYGAIVTYRAQAQSRSWCLLFDICHDRLSETVDENGYLYDSNIKYKHEINAGNIERIEFVQCYSSDPINDIEKNDFSKMTRLYERIFQEKDVNNITLRMGIKENLQLEFKIGAKRMNESSRAKINFKDMELRKSLWPVLIGKESKKDK